MTTKKLAKTTPTPAPAVPTLTQTPVLNLHASIERIGTEAPAPKITIDFKPGTPLRVMNAEMYRIAADLELRSPATAGWLVRPALGHGAARSFVRLELVTGSEEEAAEGHRIMQLVILDWWKRASAAEASTVARVTRPTFEELTDRLDTLLDAERTKVRKGIDAAACRTRSDWDAAHKADDAAGEARDAFDALLRKAVS